MKRLIPILAIAFVMAFGSVSATSYTNINTLTTTIVSPVQDEAASDDAEESIGFHQELKNRFIEGGPWFVGCIVTTPIEDSNGAV